MVDIVKDPTPEQTKEALGAFEKIGRFYQLAETQQLLEVLVSQKALDVESITGVPFDIYLHGSNSKLTDRIAEVCFEEASRIVNTEASAEAWAAVGELPQSDDEAVIEANRKVVQDSPVIQKYLAAAILAGQLFSVYQALKAAASSAIQITEGPAEGETLN